MKLLIILIFFITFAFSKKDFYYSFIDSNGNQISHQLKKEIIKGSIFLDNIEELIKDGRINSAYEKLKIFKDKNKLKVLESDIILLYTELLLKKNSKRFYNEGIEYLENAINSSLIHEEDLPKAYMLLVDLKLKTNKVDDARFFALNIVNNFDNKITKAYGQIYLAKIQTHAKNFDRAIKILYDILSKTDDILIATLVADELFDLYILSDKRDKAYELIQKVLKRNIDYYVNDSYLAVQKVNKLVLADMHEFAVEILLELLDKTKKANTIEEFKFLLANIYMDMNGGSNYYLFKAKELYKEILNDFPEGKHRNKAKVFIDEILMREGKLDPILVSAKYQDSSSMKQKSMMQELINAKKLGNYEQALKSKKIYKKVSNTIAKRFGYENVNEIFDEINILLIKKYLNESECFSLDKALETASKSTIIGLIEDEKTKYNFFKCLIEVPNERSYLLVKDAFNSSRDANMYYYLERIAYSLGLINEAFRFSLKIDMTKDKDIMKKEFLSRFLVYASKNDSNDMDRFFQYTIKNEDYIEFNEHEPKIIDFYYRYYLYLLKEENINKAENILNKLNEKQNEFNAKVYSPFVELELSKIDKNNNNYESAIDILENFLKRKRKIKNNDLAKIYFELSKLYEEVDNREKYVEVVTKCKNIKNADDSYYKKMCDKL